MRDPDGYLIEVGQATGLLEGVWRTGELTGRTRWARR
jgi:hypothetical protein